MSEIQGPDRPTPRSTGKAAKGRRAASADPATSSRASESAARTQRGLAQPGRAAVAPRAARQLESVVERLRSLQEIVVQVRRERIIILRERPQPTGPGDDASTGASAGGSAGGSGASTDVPSEPIHSEAATTAGITISGQIRQTHGAVTEERVGLDTSAVAAHRGVAAVRLDQPGEGVTFRFQDLGDGLVRATRYEMQDGDEVATGTQTLAIPGVGGSSPRAPAPGTLTFGQLGLELDLDSAYTAGDLQFVEIASGPSDRSQVSASRATRGDQASAASAEAATVADAGRVLALLDEREQKILVELSAEEETLVQLLGQLTGSDESLSLSALLGAPGTDTRSSVLRQLSDLLMAQEGPSADRVMQLLS